MSLKKRIDFAYLGFEGEIDIILLNFKKGFPFSREVTMSRKFFIKFVQFLSKILDLLDEGFANTFVAIRNSER